MVMDFSWLSQIFEAVLSFVPRRVIVRATHRGVKWRMFKGPRELKPGVRWYWPLITEIEVIVVARQTLNTAQQSLLTADGKEIVVGGVAVYSINDVVKAIGERNYDVDDTVNDIIQAAIVEVLTAWNLEDLIGCMPDLERDLTKVCRRQLRQYGVYVHRAALTDFSTCPSMNIMGINPIITAQS
jgi:regulator of protease activity HflC (stomatin/prohibitin superfamily)